jgi:hypothetical protein
VAQLMQRINAETNSVERANLELALKELEKQ